MSSEGGKSVTHDNPGTEPAMNELKFKLSWTEPEPKMYILSYENTFTCPRVSDWESFKRDLFQLVTGFPEQCIPDYLVNYIDSDEDQIPIESESEFTEALRTASRSKETGRKFLHFLAHQRESKEIETKSEITQTRSPNLQSPLPDMPPINLNNAGPDFVGSPSHTNTIYNVNDALNLGNTLPKWFSNYMETMKKDIVAEVTKNVTEAVIEALQMEHPTRNKSASTFNRVPNSENVPAEEHFDSTEEMFKATLQRMSPEESEDTNYNRKLIAGKRKKADSPAKGLAAKSHTEDDSRGRRTRKDIEVEFRDSSSGSNRDPCENKSRRRYRVSEKPRKKHGKTSAKTQNEFRALLTQSSSGHSGLIEKSPTPKNASDSDSTEVVTDVCAMMRLELENLLTENAKQYMTNKEKILNDETNTTEDKVRMGCSVTGNNEMLDDSNEWILDCCGLSDSDNISIISNVSHSSETQKSTCDPDKTIPLSMYFPDKTEDATAFERQVELLANDEEGSRNSSSFVLLSDSTSPLPCRCMHIKENHFSQENDVKCDKSIDDDEKLKITGQNEFATEPYVVDPKGTIYNQSYLDLRAHDEEKTFEKRTDGAYSFTGDRLPGSSKESVPQKPEISNNEDAARARNENKIEDKTSEENLNDETTQSFHSHTASQTENENGTFEKYTTASDEFSSSTSRRNIFVDENVSKGLGDTKQSSPRKESNKNSTQTDSSSERARTWRRPSESFRRASFPWRHRNGRQPDDTRFNNSSGAHGTRVEVITIADPMQILPETFVTGAVHVADSVYTVARRICDIVLAAHETQKSNRKTFKRN